jgi:hypothetical protein
VRRLALALLVVAGPGCLCRRPGLARDGELGAGAALVIENRLDVAVDEVRFVQGNAACERESEDQLEAPLPPGASCDLSLRPGRYRVRVVAGGPLAEALVEVPPGVRVVHEVGR